MRTARSCTTNDEELERIAREFDRAMAEFSLAVRRRFMSIERDNPATATELATRALRQLKGAVESRAASISLVDVLP